MSLVIEEYLVHTNVHGFVTPLVLLLDFIVLVFKSSFSKEKVKGEKLGESFHKHQVRNSSYKEVHPSWYDSIQLPYFSSRF